MRVALARALATRPRLLLLDEPLGALDPASRAELLPLLASLPRTLGGTPILHVTHDFEEAFRLADHLAILLDGRLAAAGAPGALFARPPTPEVADFLHLDNVLAGTFEPAGPELSAFRRGALTLYAAGSHRGEGWLAFDGTAVLLTAAAPSETSARNVVTARVLGLETLPRGVLVCIDAGGVELRARITAAARDALHLAPGSSVCALLKATSLQVMVRS
jgi:molybdate transport system ATP-binding protein